MIQTDRRSWRSRFSFSPSSGSLAFLPALACPSEGVSAPAQRFLALGLSRSLRPCPALCIWDLATPRMEQTLFLPFRLFYRKRQESRERISLNPERWRQRQRSPLSVDPARMFVWTRTSPFVIVVYKTDVLFSCSWVLLNSLVWSTSP